MEAEALGEERGMAAAVGPGVVEVPDEVVEEGEFNGRGGGEEIVAGETAVDEGEGGKLHGHADGSDEIELAPADEEVHGGGPDHGCTSVHGNGAGHGNGSWR
jgi:hypothetical protein